jgi:hypothetical protein
VDPDPAIFVIDLQNASKKLIFNTIFSAYYFLRVHLHHFSKIKSQKEPPNSRNQGFSYYFCMMIEGSGSGSIPLTNGSGSGSRVVDPDLEPDPDPYWIRILDPDSIGSVDPHPDPYSESGSGTGSRRAKMTHKSRKNW